jgi:lipopolysaccharide export system permease protein
LSKGSIQTRSLTGAGDVKISNFDEYAMALPMQGSGALPERGWHGVYELSPSGFKENFQQALVDQRQLGEWSAEAAKRFGVPMLALSHTLLALALGLAFGNITGRRGAGGGLMIMAAPTAHIIFLVSLESLMRLNWRYAFLLAALAVLETGVSIWLISRLNRNDPPVRIESDAGPEDAAISVA